MTGALLILLLACATGLEDAALQEGTIQDQDPAAAVRTGLILAVSIWQQGDGKAAAAQVRSTAELGLAPLLPELRAFDPQRSLELEYSFGLLAAHAAKTGPEATFSQEADALSTRVEEALADAKAAREAAVKDPTAQDPAAGQSSAGSNGEKSP